MSSNSNHQGDEQPLRPEIKIERIIPPSEIKTEFIENSYQFHDSSILNESSASDYLRPQFKQERVDTAHKLSEQDSKNIQNEAKMIYTCCNLVFEDKYEHFDHMIQHAEDRLSNNDKPFECSHCKRLFSTQNDMKSHFEKMHKSLKCWRCSVILKNKYLLRNHLQTAHRIKPRNIQYKRKPNLQWQKDVMEFQNTLDSIRENVLKMDQYGVKIEPKSENIKMEDVKNVLKIKKEPISIKEETFSDTGNETFVKIKMEPLL